MRTAIQRLVENIHIDPRQNSLIGERNKVRGELAQHNKSLEKHRSEAMELQNSIDNLNRQAGRVSEIRLIDTNPTYNRLQHQVDSLTTINASIDDLQDNHITPCENTLKDLEKQIVDMYGEEDRKIAQAVEAYLTVFDTKDVKAHLMDAQEARHPRGGLAAKVVKAIHQKIYPNG